MQLKHLTSLALGGLASGQSLTDVISQNADLSTLGSLLQQFPSVADGLANANNLTVLAPNNAAFATYLDASVNASIQADPGLVPAVLQYHVLAGTIQSTQITETPVFAKTLLTNASYTNVTGGQVVKAQSQNGAVVFTSGLLKQSNVTTADVTFSGGVVHIIDTVLTIPQNDSTTVIGANLTSLAGALTQANLVSTVDEAMDVTIFAPTNDAFAAISNLVGNLTTEQLSAILTYHVVQGTVGYSTNLTNGSTLTTLQGGPVKVTLEGTDVFINSAKVVTADVLLNNGVAHVIDNVLNPNNTSATPDPAASTQAPAFSGASSGSDVPFTSGVATATSTSTATATGGDSTGSSTAGVPRQTAAVGAAALFGGAAFFANM